MTINATPYKLRNGTWGIKVRDHAISARDAVTVTTRSGKSWAATVDRILWAGDGVTLATTVANAERAYDHGMNEGGDGYNPHRDGVSYAQPQQGCDRCRRTPYRTAQLFEECDHCGTEPIYM